MGGNYGKQKKIIPPSESEGSESESDSGSSSKASSRTRSRKTPPPPPRSPTKVNKQPKPYQKLGNDDLYRNINQQQQQKQPVKINLSPNQAGAKSSSPNRAKPTSAPRASVVPNNSTSKYYINKKDLGKNEAIILMPKKQEKKPSSKPTYPFGMQYQQMPYGTANNQMMFENKYQHVVVPGQENMVKWEQKAVSPFGQQYQYYFDQRKDAPGVAQYEHTEVVKFDGGQLMSPQFKVNQQFERQVKVQQPYQPKYAPRSPLQPGSAEANFYYAHNYAQAYGLPPLPALPPQPPQPMFQMSMGMSTGFNQQQQAQVNASPTRPRSRPVSPKKEKQQVRKTPPSSSTAKQLESLNRNVKELVDEQKAKQDKMNEFYRKMKNEFQVTMKELAKQRDRYSNSNIGNSVSMLDQSMSKASDKFNDISSKVEILNQGKPQSPRASQSQVDAIMIDQMNAKIERFLNYITQLKYSHNVEMLQKQQNNHKSNSSNNK